MLVPDPTIFPGNILVALGITLGAIDPDLKVYYRPLRSSDADLQCIGIFVTDKQGIENSKEIRGMGNPAFSFPTLHQYFISIQGMITDSQEDRGIATHSVLANRIYAAVATSPALRIALSALSSPFGTMTEHAERWMAPRQRYLVNEVSGIWYYLSITEFELETRIN